MDPDAADLVRRTVSHLIDRGLTARGLYAEEWTALLAENAFDPWRILCDELGRHLAPCTLVDAVVAERAGFDPTATRVVYATSGTDAVGLALGEWPPEPPPSVLVVATDGTATASKGGTAFRVCRPVRGVDPSLAAVEIAIDRSADAVLEVDDAPALVAVGRVALGTILLGACRRMLDVSVAHSIERRQFGRPIGSFQAVKHHLADVYVAIEAAQAAVDEAWLTSDPREAELAKALAGQASAVTSRWALQVLGAMGFTWEHELHRYTRRTMVLDLVLGSAREIGLAVGARLLRECSAPRIGQVDVRPSA